jgi:pilus assembly protein CpaB
MRRSSILMLAGAVLLGLLAVFAGRMILSRGSGGESAAPATYAVVAAKPIAFGDKITASQLKLAPWPTALPEGAFRATDEVVADGSRVALRAIGQNELLLATAISGTSGRLSSSGLLPPDMRAVSFSVTESTAAGGFVTAGDRVDIFVSRETDNGGASAELLVQAARVLATGQDADTSRKEARIVKSTTVAVTPEEAQLIALAQQSGSITLALRHVSDLSETPLPIVRLAGSRSSGASAPAAPPPAAPAGPVGPPRPSGPTVTVFRGSESTQYTVPGL